MDQGALPRRLHGWRLILTPAGAVACHGVRAGHQPDVPPAGGIHELGETASCQPGWDGGDPVHPRRRLALSREMVAEAALGVGFENLTVTAVAARIGVSHPALYRHVTSRADLVAAAVDRLFAAAAWPAPASGWRHLLEAEAWARWGLFRDHPGLATAIRGLTRTPAEVDRRSGVVAGCLMHRGFAADDAIIATTLVCALPLDQMTRPALPATAGEDVGSGLTGWPVPAPGRLATRSPGTDPGEWFRQKLAVLLDGIAAGHARCGTGQPTPGLRPSGRERLTGGDGGLR